MKTGEVITLFNDRTGRAYSRTAFEKMRQRGVLDAVKLADGNWHWVRSSVERLIGLCHKPVGFMTYKEIAVHYKLKDTDVESWFNHHPPADFKTWLPRHAQYTRVVISPADAIHCGAALLWAAPTTRDIHAAMELIGTHSMRKIAGILGVQASYLSRAASGKVVMSRDIWLSMLEIADDIKAGHRDPVTLEYKIHHKGFEK